MTNEEAIKIIGQYDVNFYWTEGEPIPAEKLTDALDMAIEALKAQSGKDINVRGKDTVYRQDAIDTVTKHYRAHDNDLLEVIAYEIEQLPSAEKRTNKRTETHACDCISRQAAIDIERNATVDTNPSHFEAHQKFTQFMDDAEISSFGRWQWSNGFNTALTAVGIDLKKLPSAEPEIIRCKDCVYWKTGTVSKICARGIITSIMNRGDEFCSYAERRTDDE